MSTIERRSFESGSGALDEYESLGLPEEVVEEKTRGILEHIRRFAYGKEPNYRGVLFMLENLPHRQIHAMLMEKLDLPLPNGEDFQPEGVELTVALDKLGAPTTEGSLLCIPDRPLDMIELKLVRTSTPIDGNEFYQVPFDVKYVPVRNIKSA